MTHRLTSYLIKHHCSFEVEIEVHLHRNSFQRVTQFRRFESIKNSRTDGKRSQSHQTSFLPSAGVSRSAGSRIHSDSTDRPTLKLLGGRFTGLLMLSSVFFAAAVMPQGIALPPIVGPSLVSSSSVWVLEESSHVFPHLEQTKWHA